jgi:two-component system cell cycle response regulator DivK
MFLSETPAASRELPEETSLDRTILVVEDDERNMRFASDVLEVLGYAVLKAGDATTGLALARERRPDLILMDVGLPGMPGDEAVRRLKADAELSAIPVVILTAFAMTHQVAELSRCGCQEVRTKPVGVQTLRDIVDRYAPLDGRHAA